MSETPTPAETPARKPFEEHAKAKGTAPWLLAATKAHMDWPTGREVTEAEFDEAVKATANIRIS